MAEPSSPPSSPPPRRSERPTRRAASERVAVVINGNAKQVTKDLVAVLDQVVRTGDLFVSRSLEEGREIARTIVARGYSTVLTGGGDGTFVQMVTWIHAEAAAQGQGLPRFGLLRLGTGNALAWVLGAQGPRGLARTEKAVATDLARLATEGGSRSLRLLEVEGRLSPFAGMGGDALALKHFNETKELLRRVPVVGGRLTGGVSYAVAILGRTFPEYLMRQRVNVRIVNEGSPADRLGVDGQPVGSPIQRGETLYEGPYRVVAMSTIPYWGFGARVFPFANDREDRFSLRVIDLSPVQVVTHLRAIWRGTYRGDTVHDFLVDRVSVHFPTPVPLQIGGDPTGDRRVVHASLAPNPIEVVDYYAPPPVE